MLLKKVTEKQALQLLRNNIVSTTTNTAHYFYAVPSKEYYTHQWFWDSCMHAMGFAFCDTQMAKNELASLLLGQWENGHIGHITYNNHDASYFPQKELWKTQQFSQNGIVSSGLIQPPLLAISFLLLDTVLAKKQQNREFIDKFLGNVMKYHDYLKRERDQENSGLITIFHPWESGTDNSPRWDRLLGKIKITTIPQGVIQEVQKNRKDVAAGSSKNRPQTEDYYRYIYLIYVYKSLAWNSKKMQQKVPFAVKDVLVNSIWARANQALAALLKRHGRREEAKTYTAYAKQTIFALQKSWSPEKKLFANYDCSSGQMEPYYEDTIANFLPLYPHAASESMLSSLLSALTNMKSYQTPFPVPSTPLTNPSFEITRYWRGPTWPITNVFLIEGLLGYKNLPAQALGKKLLRQTVGMIEKFGFYEHYDPIHGLSPMYKTEKVGMGFGNFSWSAATYLYLTNQYKTLLV